MQDISTTEALDAINELRSNIIATQSASWSNTCYPLVAILDSAGYECDDNVTREKRSQHISCYGGAGGYPGHLKGEPSNSPYIRPVGERERVLEDKLRTVMVRLLHGEHGKELGEEIHQFIKENEL